MIDWTALWLRAEEEELGIAIPTDQLRDVARHLYKAKPRTDIRLVFPSNGKEVWLVKKTVEIVR